MKIDRLPTIQQLREIYLRAQQLRTQHPETDVTRLVDTTVGDPRWARNFVFVESHRREVGALHLTVTAGGRPLPVMDVVDSTDPLHEGAAHEAPLHVLFIGNSLTYVNDIPAQFRAIAANGLHRRIVTRMITIPGAALTDLWHHGTGVAPRVLASQAWDVVVLQGRLDQVTQPNSSDMSSLIQSVDTTTYNAIVRAVVDRQTPAHGQTLLYLPSQGDDESELTRAVYDSIHTYAGRVLGIPVAHGGDMVYRLKSAHPELQAALFEPGGDHQSALGAYFQALLVYVALTHQSPVGVPHPVLPGLTDSLATLFQRVAAGGGSPAPAASHSTPLPAPQPVVAELFSDFTCASCAAAESALLGLLPPQTTPGATLIPLVWPVGIPELDGIAQARQQFAPSAVGTTASSKGALPVLALDGVPVTLQHLTTAAIQRGREPHQWVTAYALSSDASDFAARLDPVPTAAPADSLEVWAVLTEDRAGPEHRHRAVVRRAQLLRTVSARDGLELQQFPVPTPDASVVMSQTTLIVLVQPHDRGRILGAAVVPLPVIQ